MPEACTIHRGAPLLSLGGGTRGEGESLVVKTTRRKAAKAKALLLRGTGGVPSSKRGPRVFQTKRAPAELLPQSQPRGSSGTTPPPCPLWRAQASPRGCAVERVGVTWLAGRMVV